MRAPIDRVDIIREGINLLVITVVVLNSDFDRERVTNLLKVDWLVVQHGFVLVQVLHELSDTAAIVKLVRLLVLFPLIFDRYPDAFVEKSFFAQALGKFVEAELGRIKNLRVRFESDLGSAFAGLPGLLERGNRYAAFVLLFVGQTIAPNFQVQSFRKK